MPIKSEPPRFPHRSWGITRDGVEPIINVDTQNSVQTTANPTIRYYAQIEDVDGGTSVNIDVRDIDDLIDILQQAQTWITSQRATLGI